MFFSNFDRFFDPSLRRCAFFPYGLCHYCCAYTAQLFDSRGGVFGPVSLNSRRPSAYLLTLADSGFRGWWWLWWYCRPYAGGVCLILNFLVFRAFSQPDSVFEVNFFVWNVISFRNKLIAPVHCTSMGNEGSTARDRRTSAFGTGRDPHFRTLVWSTSPELRSFAYLFTIIKFSTKSCSLNVLLFRLIFWFNHFLFYYIFYDDSIL